MSFGATPRALGRYVLYDQIAAGGMATVHFGRMQGAIGFSRLVAIKRLHPNYASDAHFVQMFLDEARLAARLDHPNVVTTLDVVADETEVFLVMEHILGEALEGLMPRDVSLRAPANVASAIICGVLEGLHSAHEARGDDGEALEIVHRDVSPHNILVGVDGVARVFDFGIAKAAINTQETREGVIKGKVTYMAPEQVRGNADRRADVYAAAVILWELLAGRRRHAGERNDTLFLKLARNELTPPTALSTLRSDVPIALDAIIARATDGDPTHRFETAREMAVALESAVPPAPARDVADWVRSVAGTRIERTSAVMRRIESDAQSSSEARLSLSPARPATSTGSMHGVTATIGAGGTSRPPHAEAATSSSLGAPPPRRSWTMLVALLVLPVALFLIGLRTLSRREVRAATPEHSDAATSEPNSAPALAKAPDPLPPPSKVGAVTATTTTATTATPDAAAPRPTAQPTRVVYVTPPPVVRPPPRETATAAPPPRPETPSAAAAPGHKPGCESPFSIGADGIRQIKPECL